MQIHFPFREEHSQIFGTILRPVAKVTFANEEISVPQWVYVDSGADVTLIPKSVGELLGFRLANEEISKVKGIGQQTVPVVFRKLKVQIGKKEVTIHVAWSLIEEVPMLLERKDILDYFEITLTKNKTIFTATS